MNDFIKTYIFPGEEADLAVVKGYAERWGYGRLMQFLSEEWHKKDPHGALTVGPTFAEVANEQELLEEDEEVLDMVDSEEYYGNLDHYGNDDMDNN